MNYIFNRRHYHCLLFISFLPLLICCKQATNKPVSAADLLHNNQDKLTQVIIYDVFTPPVAARLYVYSSLASYEAARFAEPGFESITSRLHGFKPMPQPIPGKQYNFSLAATRAFFMVVHKLVFSVDSLQQYENFVDQQFHDTMDMDSYNRSIALGDSIGKIIMERAMNDGYVKARGKPKYLGSNEAGKWRPTPPDYLDGVEWCWNTMRPMLLDSCSQFTPPKPPLYSTDSSSTFYKNALQVYNISKSLSPEQKIIARYWDDNPFVIEHSGHMMFGNKKITPGGHWMGIAAIASRKTGAGMVKTARAYALTSIALFDAFIACWDEKYRSNVVRPVTVINEQFDDGWSPFLQTPPFPEYPSGHSAITASASAVLTRLFGDNFSFQDTSDLRYIGMQRHFNSFREAAAEASLSRVYGGIHYMSAVQAGAAQGSKVGSMIIDRLQLK